MKLICCMALVVVVSAVAFSQTPKSGAMLTINGTVNTDGGPVSVNQNIYDSEIHTGNVRSTNLAVADETNCNSVDAGFPTDAYVLQGGSWTGCDPGDTFETTQGTGLATIPGPGSGFGISTFYTFGSSEVPQCNTNGNICVPTNGPDSGFLTVTNNSGASFTGTISLAGTSTIAGGSCPTNGTALDTKTGTLASGSSWTFALSTDSSNCGGFNQTQTKTLSHLGTIQFQAGADLYTIVAANNTGGEAISFLPVPVPQNGSGAPAGAFNPGSLFSGDTCDTYTDLNGPGNPVCSEFHLSCSGASDCSTFSYKVTTNYDQTDQGTPHFLKAIGANCPPPSGFDENIFTSYIFTVDPLKGGGSGGGSCFAATYLPGTAQTTNVSISTYASNFYPAGNLRNPPFVNAASAGASGIPLVWQSFDASTNALITPSSSNTFSLCTNSNISTCGPNTVATRFVPVGCGTLALDPQVKTSTTSSNTNAGLQFNGPTAQFPNTWQINVKSSKSFAGTCQVLQLIFTGSSTGGTGVQSTHSTFWKFH